MLKLVTAFVFSTLNRSNIAVILKRLIVNPLVEAQVQHRMVSRPVVAQVLREERVAAGIGQRDVDRARVRPPGLRTVIDRDTKRRT